MRYDSTITATLVAGCLAIASGNLDSFAAVEDPGAQTGDEVAKGEETRHRIDAQSAAALEELLRTNDNAKKLFNEAYGYAVFKATKAGLIVTGGGGAGVAVNKATGDRTYMRMGTGGVGLGAGVQTLRLIILFESESTFDAFIDDGSWDSTVSAQAAAGKAGKNFASSFVDHIAVFQLTEKGLMAQADLTGTRFWVSDELNQQ